MVDALAEHELFVRDLLALYKRQRVLWQQNHPNYRNRAEKAKSYQLLVEKAKEYYPDADEDFVRLKIESMRGSFRKERRKVLQSMQNCSNPEDFYKPSLWYYDLLLFTAGEEPDKKQGLLNVRLQETDPKNGNAVSVPFWTRAHSALLIKFYKNNPCLYSISHPFYKNKRRRYEALRKITDKLMDTTGKTFNAADVRKKISLLRGQFLKEFKKVKITANREEVYKPRLWCFNMLNFLKNEYKESAEGDQEDEEDSPENIESEIPLRQKRREINNGNDVKLESDFALSPASIHLEMDHDTHDSFDDIFATIAANLAHQLREMTEEQRNIANKIVRDVMYHGQMEKLTSQSRLILDST